MYYVMSDIHGCYTQMMKALSHWDSEKEHLVVIGDLIDRGPDSLLVVRELMMLREKHPENVTILKGNHEEMLLAWLMNTHPDLLDSYYNPMHRETLQSFMGKKRFQKSTRTQRAKDLIYKNKEELNFMNDLPLYLETEKMIFVHAGVDLYCKDWRQSTDDMLWIRNQFIYSKTTPEKRVFFGHTPTRLIHPDTGKKTDGIWVSPDNSKVGIDGGVSMGGQLNALRVGKDSNILESLVFI